MYSHNNINTDNLDDIELRVSNEKIPKNNSELFNKNLISNFCIKFGIWLFIIILSLPIPFFDLYYGYNDNTCVNESSGKLLINLKDYLIVYGWVGISVLGCITFYLYSIDIYSNNNNDSPCKKFGYTIFSFILNSFILIWNIFGSIIFWSLMDTDNCSKQVYNYVFTSLIIKLVFTAISILQNNNNK